MKCPHSDLVIARFLDGDLSGTPDESPLDLAQHAGDCPACRQALARSRQLDALLASSCGDGLDEAATARLLATVRAPRRSQPVRRSAVAALLAAGLLLGAGTTWLLLGRAAPRDEVQVGHAAAADTPPSPTPTSAGQNSDGARVTPPQWIAIDVAPGTPTPARTWSAPRASAPHFDSRELIETTRLQAHARDWVLHLLTGVTTPLDPRAAVQAARVEAGRQQLDGQASFDDLLAILQRDEPAAAALLVHAAAHRGFRQRLSALLDKPAVDGAVNPGALCVAVRLGNDDIDRRVLARVRRDQVLTERLAEACARAVPGVDRTGFLLELWATWSRAAGDEGGDTLRREAERARRWFVNLPDADDALLTQLRQTRSNEARRRVVLALAARTPAAAIPTLLQLLDGPNSELAHLATYALGCYEADAIPRLRQATRTARRPDLVWTALLSLGDPHARARLPRLNLGRTEVALVSQGPLHPAQVAALAAALRNRPLTLLEQP